MHAGVERVEKFTAEFIQKGLAIETDDFYRGHPLVSECLRAFSNRPYRSFTFAQNSEVGAPHRIGVGPPDGWGPQGAVRSLLGLGPPA